MKHLKIINYSSEIEAIEKEFEEREETQKAAASLWGFECNSSGVIMKCEVFDISVSNSCYAEIRIAKSNKNFFMIGISANTEISGISYMPRVLDEIGYRSREDARLAAISRIERFYQSEEGSKNSCSSQTNKKAIRKMLKKLNDERQPSLFALI